MAAHYSSSIVPPSANGTGLPLSLSALSAEFGRLSNTTLASSVVLLVVTLLLVEQSVWRWKKGPLPGHKWQIPIIGQFADSLKPTMEGYMKTWETPMSAISVFNIFIVMVSTPELARKVLHASNSAEPCVVQSAKKVLEPDNWVFLNGKVHNEYRKGLNCLFTRGALAIYLKMQDRIYREHFARWVAEPDHEHKPYQMLFRDLNMDTSLRTFCGNYTAEADVREISNKYWLITTALELVNFPWAFPGTKVWHACRARALAVKHLEAAAASSKKSMAAGKEPDCLLDAWVEQIMAAKNYREKKDEGAERPNLILREYSDHEMALVLLSFIFASQDAMSSSITFAFQHLADYPKVLAKLREEQYRLRGSDLESAVTLEDLDQMPYTNAVVREVLRHRGPVTMIPYLTTKPFALTENYTVPVGTGGAVLGTWEE